MVWATVVRRALAAGVGVILAVSCSNNSSAAAPSPVLATEDFTGVISPLGTDSHTFTVNYTSAASNASITVTTLTTVANNTAAAITVGVGFGTVNVGLCTRDPGHSNPAAPINTELPTTDAPFGPGLYCVQVFDNPNAPTVTEPLNYKITVKHF
jgi:hypothetical protein